MPAGSSCSRSSECGSGREHTEAADASLPATAQLPVPDRLLIAIAKNTASTGTSNRLA
jgi:hypothetical protein